MPLAPQTSLGPYRIEEAVGKGGMGEVYRATDTRLDRSVAIKILPTELSLNPELRQRFEREARAISGLQHPHICSLFDIGSENGVDFLVMEFIEGENLASRLASGALPPQQVLEFGAQITRALEAAHKSGIVHRDLKPGNIMITREGVKLLDFGLAKAVEETVAPSDSSMTNLPTVKPGTGEPLTSHGTILGTYQYMSPEQLEGKDTDVRSDIFALGAVLYEMSTGRKAFEGESQASLIASIMGKQPAPISSIHPNTPPALDRVIQTCMEKDPEDRWQTAHDVALQLKWIGEGGSGVGLPKAVSARRHRRERLAWLVAAVAGLAAVALLALRLTAPAPPEQEVVRFQIEAPPGVMALGFPRLSPDGTKLAFDAVDSTGTTSLWVRSLSSLESRRIPGTEGCGRAFWSPDSKHLAYFQGDDLKRVDLLGSPPLLVCTFPNGADGAWGAQGHILMDGSTGDSVNVVLAGGGTPRGATTLDRARGDNTHGWPSFLPDGKRFLFLAYGESFVEVRLGELGSFETTTILESDSRIEYVPPGFIVFERDRTLLAVPFDVDSGSLEGDPFPLLKDIGTGGFGLADFSGSQNGTLAYMQRSGGGRVLSRMARDGTEVGMVGESGNYGNPHLSPDQRYLAFNYPGTDAGDPDIWVEDLVRGSRSQLTFENANVSPLWSPDGRSIVYSTDPGDGFVLHMRNADGTGEARKLSDMIQAFPTSWSKDGRWLLFMARRPNRVFDIMSLDLEDENAEPEVVVSSAGFDGEAVFSPDGEYFAYAAEEEGRNVVYLATFPPGGGRWLITTATEGSRPQWRGDGRELFFHDSRGNIVSVSVDLEGDAPQLGIPQRLFPTRSPVQGLARNYFIPRADGQEFYVINQAGSEEGERITVVMNWAEELRNR